MQWTRETRGERQARQQEWHRWFAWRPVRLWQLKKIGDDRTMSESNRIIWLERIMRKKNVYGPVLYMRDEDAFMAQLTKYRLPRTRVEPVFGEDDE
jgi:hypothetical protein